ncbi:site-specific recombinase XerD [Hoeflea halophila]|uniref:Site-specific recombinase XerD n=1 Tax=Hoeflea halophila TaxID=714899 RepID=A0A286IFF7_9HYPH|nr:site-specific integrase [Hoeflea halophila]SOE18858.1 site-specific recombinase XerD [Hoeflea halophila]
MPMQKISDRWLASVQPQPKQIEYFDAAPGHKGLSIMVGKSGSKAWFLNYTGPKDGKRKRYKIGAYPGVGLAKARTEAARLRADIGEGADPLDSRRAETVAANEARADTFAKLVEAYLQSSKFKSTSASNRRDIERTMRKDVLSLIGETPLSELSRRTLQKPVEAKINSGAQRMGEAIFRYLKVVLNWGADMGYIEANPLPRRNPNATPMENRERVLTNAEISALWNEFPNWTAGPRLVAIYRLIVLTGQRSNEVAGLMRDEIDTTAAIWALPRERAKNGKPNIVPLSAPALAIVREAMAATNGDHLFPTDGGEKRAHIGNDTISNTIRKWQEGRGVADRWTPHDLRRTAATRMNEIGVQPHIVEAILNHVSGAKAGVAGVYNRADYIEQKRAALDAWAAELGRIVG